MTSDEFRIEHDSMGELRVPAQALYGAQTQRAVQNFPISGLAMPASFVRTLARVKAACARANADLGLLEPEIAEAIGQASARIAGGEFAEQFPVDVFQTGSGTSTNMNANEVIAHLASEIMGRDVHPNDHVNMSQSSNDVIPTTLAAGACIDAQQDLLPALAHLRTTLEGRAGELDGVIKTGRTHLMDAMPVSMGQELAAWAHQVRLAEERIAASLERLRELPQGGTAVGTGINAHPEFGARVAAVLAEATGVEFRASRNAFVGLATQDSAVELSGQLRALAVALMKIANDLRWMNSGPLAGLGEIALPALQPGSSIMPGKVNPVIPEAVCMVSAQVMGNDATVAVAGQAGSFQLNVMLPVIAHNLLQSIGLLANASRVLADKAVAGFTVNEETLKGALDRNPILVTALNRIIGYEQGARIAKLAYAQGRPILEVAREETGLDEAELKRLLDPAQLTRGGVPE
jgi:fumarate hydratase class II